ncbi:MerR family transcriptional regulator [Streptomyces sp. NPDC093221]|uniref:MerR family transcriptional regulator n=1 Tax=Streptomyces sp. NPDC093221 TaxID=3366032 RepID=UPI0037F58C51
MERDTGPGLMGIGAFSKAARLSQRALRLYDELGLLSPARVDPATGYRWYAPEQLEKARLVAWLRRLGMPLAGIQEVCAQEGRDAALSVRAYWTRVEADTAARRDLAAFLIDYLSWKDPAMSAATAPLGIRYAALSDTGLVRESNQDTAYAGSRLLAVADGFGTGGAPAGAAAVDVLKRLDAGANTVPAGELLNALEDAVEQAGRAVRGVAAAEREPGHVGTTLTAMFWTGSQLALVHIGDSRAYLLRDGGFFQITHDHTMVQSMVDEGRLSPAEAESHPQRSLLARALSGTGPATDGSAGADIRLQDARPGDRYLLCSDGLSAVVPADDVHATLATTPDPDDAVRALVALANRNGGPDNVSCVVADVVELPA